MTSSSSSHSHHHDASSTTSTPRAGASSGSSYGNGFNGNGNGFNGNGNGGHGNGNGNGNGGHGNGNGNGGHGNGNGNGGNHHQPPPHAPSSQAQAQALAVALGGPCVRLMCSFGGRILPRPGDHRLRYVGGETRIVSVPRTASHALLTAALARLAPALFAPGAPQPTLRYQLPQDDLDSLISVSSDDDVDNLMDEIDRVHSLAATAIKPPRLRLFLFASSQDHSSSAAAFGSVLSGTGDSASTDKWFVDQLNAPAPSSLECGRSEASSIVSENMDPFGLDATSDNPSPDTAPADAAAADPKSASDDKAEMAHGDDHDDKPAPVLRDRPVATYVAETAPWPAPPPQYMQHPMYFYPPRPVHYLDPAGQQCTYIPGPGYHIVGGGGNQVQGDLYASGSVYGGPHSAMQQTFRHQVVYTPPLVATEDRSAEGKPKEEGGSQSHSS